MDTEELTDDETCVFCDKGSVEASDYLYGKVQCLACGRTYDPESLEEVEEWTGYLYLEFSDMTRSEALNYIDELLDHINVATGHRLQFDHLD